MTGVEFRIREFQKFHSLLIETAPPGYVPHYFKCGIESKAPIPGVGWKSTRARLDKDEAIAWIRGGGNLALGALENDPLQIVDCDTDEVYRQLKPTLQTIGRSRTGGHGWYWVDGEETP